MRLGMIQGKKAEQDMIQLIKCDCGNDYAPTYPWIAELLVRLIKNEGLIYKEKNHQQKYNNDGCHPPRFVVNNKIFELGKQPLSFHWDQLTGRLTGR